MLSEKINGMPNLLKRKKIIIYFKINDDFIN